MTAPPSPQSKPDGAAEKPFRVTAPALSLPKGGGAIKSIGEKFTTNPVTGTASLAIPIFTSPGRSGFGPQLVLAYDSGGGNGPFGLGWKLSPASIVRKTDKGLPRYLDSEESDVFLLEGAEDLVPVLDASSGFPVSSEVIVHDKTYLIRQYRPRIEGLFSLIERWVEQGALANMFWRVIDRNNTTTWYGKSEDSRVADPDDPTHIFQWFICEMHDDKGNVAVTRYRREDGTAAARGIAEANRADSARKANCYPERIRYGNLKPYLPALASTPGPWPGPDDVSGQKWMFEVVFDYGDHAGAAPTTLPTSDWTTRRDPFSSHRAGFEVRTYRLCRRVLMFHHFELELGAPDYLVRSTDFDFEEPLGLADPAQPGYTVLKSVTQRSYQKRSPRDTTYESREFPPVHFTYSKPVIGSGSKFIRAEEIENLPVGIQGGGYRWVDLDGEGLSGVLTEQGGGWYYKPNLGDANFGQMRALSQQPAMAALSQGRQQLIDLAGDGQVDLVEFGGPAPGFHARDFNADSWTRFVPFASLPNLDWTSPNLRFVDLTGDGHADALITEDDVFTWHPSLAHEGFGQAERTRQAFDENSGPKMVFADDAQTIFLADMCGDGLTDLVRIRNGEVCYWPNLGYGRFGRKVTLANSPLFDHPEFYDPRRIRLADVDGSGPIDLIYLGRTGAQIYFNRSGNSLSGARTIEMPLATENLAAVQVADLLGNGTACLVWNSHLPADAAQPVRYIDLMAGGSSPGIPGKPHLLIGVNNNLGGEIEIEYAPSTRFYLEDKRNGTPWITRLPFPVHCVSKVTMRDRWRRTAFSSTYSYHHGYFDGVEREFRGFGRVEQVDVEDFGSSAENNIDSPFVTQDRTLYQPPVKTITWYHTGATLDRQRILSQFATEYFPARYPQAGRVEKDLPEPKLDPALSTGEWREALRACKGRVLRKEIYELDIDALQADLPREIPVRLFSATAHACQIRCLQPRRENRHAVFLVTESETLSYHYELDLRRISIEPDPRIMHTLNLSSDELGNVQQSVVVAYPRLREFDEPELAAETALIREVQRARQVAYQETHHTGDAIDSAVGTAPIRYHRLRAPCELQAYELTGFTPEQGGYFSLSDFRGYRLSDTLSGQGAKTVTRKPYHELPQNTAEAMRLVEHGRTLFFEDNEANPARFLKEARPLGELSLRGLTYEHYKLALTDGLLNAVFTDGQLGLTVPAGGTALAALQKTDLSGFLHDADAAAKFGCPAAGEYWMRSGIAGFAPDAAQHFYLAENYTDSFGNRTGLQYDALDLFVQSSRDALGNVTGVALDPVSGKPRFDYRVLAPIELVDCNGNHSEVRFDILGLVVAAASKGKRVGAGWEGDNLEAFSYATTNLPIAAVAEFCTSSTLNETKARDWLISASARFVYHFGDENGIWAQRLAGACAIVRERHVGQLAPGEESPLHISLECSDGVGNVLMKKSQAEPDPASTATDPRPRWIVSGLTVFNNKGKPVKQFEPAFSDDFGCELPPANGVTALMYYDAVGRLVRTEMPDGTFSRVEFSPWQVLIFDANDTIAESGNAWYARHAATGAASADQRAARLAFVHQDTPARTVLDSLGREAIAIAHNRIEDPNGTRLIGGRSYRDERYLTFTKLDAEGKPLWLRDARGNLAMQFVWPVKADRDEPRVPRDFSPSGNPNNDVGLRVPAYDIAGNLLFQRSMDAGNRWVLNDAAGKAMFSWDFNERQEADYVFVGEKRLYSTDYDALQRPTAQWISVEGGPAQQVERLEYRDAYDPDGTANAQFAADQASNLIGQLVRHYDPSGLTQTVRRDFKGNLVEVDRQLNNQPAQSAIDWQGNASAKLENETFRQLTSYDALNRMTLYYNWHRDPSMVAAYQPSYNRRGMLQSEKLRVRANRTANGPVGGVNASKPNEIREIRYNAKGQKTFLRLGNGTLTQYDYDPVTFRLKQIRTTRPGDPGGFPARRSNLADAAIVQQLLYTHDPVGNVVEIEDQAYRPVFFDNGIAEPKCQYEYDSVYRLIWTSGRESAEGGDAALAGNEPVRAQAFPITDQTLRTYSESYTYDSVGNFVTRQHVVPSQTASSWTRHFECDSSSNRLRFTWRGTNRSATETEHHYDAHGNLRNLANTDPSFNLRWDHRDLIRQLNLGGGGQVYYQYDAEKRRVRKRIERSGGATEERIYLGGYELYRRYKGSVTSAPVEEIESHHLFEGNQRVLLVDDVIVASDPANPRPDGLSVKTQTLFRYQYSNHLGSACLEIDDQARVISYEEYHPYGSSAYRAQESSAEAAPVRYRFTGMERDEESGLALHNSRYLAPALGRWVSPDPILVAGGINVYAYSSCQPVNLTDRLGTQATNYDEYLQNNESGAEIIRAQKFSNDTVKKLPPEKTPTTGREKSNDVDIDTPESDKATVDIINAAIDAALEDAKLQYKEDITKEDILRKALFLYVTRVRTRNQDPKYSQNIVLRNVDHYFAGRLLEYRKQVLGSSLVLTPGNPLSYIMADAAAVVYDASKAKSFSSAADLDKPDAKFSGDENDLPASAPGGRLWATLGSSHSLERADLRHRLGDAPLSGPLDVASLRVSLVDLKLERERLNEFAARVGKQEPNPVPLLVAPKAFMKKSPVSAMPDLR